MIIRTNFTDHYLEDMLPALDGVIFNEFEQRESRIPMVYDVRTMDGSIKQTSIIAGLGLFNEIPEGQPVIYDAPAQGPKQNYIPKQWALGFKSTRVAIEDDKIDLIKDTARDLGRSAFESTEIDAANQFNRGFNSSYLGPDGKTLFATDHPLVKGGVQANRPASHVDLDVPQLEAALTTFRGFKDEAGRKLAIKPSILLVPGELEFVAHEILGGTMRSDTSNSTINAFRNRPNGEGSFQKIVVWDYLTDPDAWFVGIEPSRAFLRWYWRKKFYTVHDVDFDSQSAKTAAWMRYARGWSHYLGWWGTAGI